MSKSVIETSLDSPGVEGAMWIIRAVRKMIKFKGCHLHDI